MLYFQLRTFGLTSQHHHYYVAHIFISLNLIWRYFLSYFGTVRSHSEALLQSRRGTIKFAITAEHILIHAVVHIGHQMHNAKRFSCVLILLSKIELVRILANTRNILVLTKFSSIDCSHGLISVSQTCMKFKA